MTAEPPDALGVCVAIPFFSNLDYLGIALRSLVAQTDSMWTAIVVDDVGPELGAEQLVAALADPAFDMCATSTTSALPRTSIAASSSLLLTADRDRRFHADDQLEPWVHRGDPRRALGVSRRCMRRAAGHRDRRRGSPDPNARRFGEARAVASPTPDDVGG